MKIKVEAQQMSHKVANCMKNLSKIPDFSIKLEDQYCLYFQEGQTWFQDTSRVNNRNYYQQLVFYRRSGWYTYLFDLNEGMKNFKK